MMKIVLIGSSKDHLDTLQELKDFWGEHEHCWVTDADVTAEALPSETQRVYWAQAGAEHQQSGWLHPQWLNHMTLAWQVLRQERPQMIIATSATIAVPFMVLAKIQGCRTAVVESLRQAEPVQGITHTLLPWLCHQTLWVW